MEDKANGDFIRCEICDAVVRRHGMYTHIRNAHRRRGMSSGEMLKVWLAETHVETAHSVEVQLTAEQIAAQKAIAYQGSAEFVSEALHTAAAQRHNKDNISLRPSASSG